MLSYQHGFHAGGYADVHKHTALCLLLDHLLRKPAPFCVIDSHAGRGRYDLSGPQAQKTGEWRQGIGRLTDAAPSSDGLRRYLEIVRGFGEAVGVQVYPGSPMIAARMMRPPNGGAWCSSIRLMKSRRSMSECPAFLRRFCDAGQTGSSRSGIRSSPNCAMNRCSQELKRWPSLP